MNALYFPNEDDQFEILFSTNRVTHIQYKVDNVNVNNTIVVGNSFPKCKVELEISVPWMYENEFKKWYDDVCLSAFKAKYAVHDYKVDAILVQYDKNHKLIKRFIIKSLYPTSMFSPMRPQLFTNEHYTFTFEADNISVLEDSCNNMSDKNIYKVVVTKEVDGEEKVKTMWFEDYDLAITAAEIEDHSSVYKERKIYKYTISDVKELSRKYREVKKIITTHESYWD